MKKLFFLFLFLFFTQALFAGVRGQLRQGGKFYNDQKYGSALNHYNEVLKKNQYGQYLMDVLEGKYLDALY